MILNFLSNSRSLGTSGYYTASQKNFPIKWTAPECIEHNKWTIASDVWSFGITLWEIFMKGEDPFPGMKNGKAKEKILEGHQMSSPPNTPSDIYEIMKMCWYLIYFDNFLFDFLLTTFFLFPKKEFITFQTTFFFKYLHNFG